MFIFKGIATCTFTSLLSIILYNAVNNNGAIFVSFVDKHLIEYKRE